MNVNVTIIATAGGGQVDGVWSVAALLDQYCTEGKYSGE